MKTKTIFIVAIALFSCLVSVAQEPESIIVRGEFVPNQGQIIDLNGDARPELLYRTSANGVENYLRADGISYVFSRLQPRINPNDPPSESDVAYRVDMNFVNVNTGITLSSRSQTEGVLNYYINDMAVTDVHGFEEVNYLNLYNNIDLLLTNNNSELVYTFTVHPGGNPQDIKFAFNGSDAPVIDAGNARMHNPIADHIFPKAEAYIFEGGIKIPWSIDYTLYNDELGFSCATSGNDIVINIGNASIIPVSHLIPKCDASFHQEWTSFYGGTLNENALDMAIDAVNHTKNLTGYTNSFSFPIFNGIITTLQGNTDAFIASFKSNNSRNFVTYFGGNGFDEGWAIGVASGGDIFITGLTSSSNFPSFIPSGAFAMAYSGNQDTYIVRLKGGTVIGQAGQLLWSTYVAGNGFEGGRALEIDHNDNIYIGGYGTTATNATNFPILNQPGAYNKLISSGGNEGFILKFNIGMHEVWGTFLGGSGNDYDIGMSMTIDGDNNLYVVGSTYSSNFPDYPVVNPPGAYTQAYAGLCDIAIAKFNSANNFIWATYFGGNDYEYPGLYIPSHSCITDNQNNFYITGETQSSNFPIFNLSGAYNDPGLNGTSDAYISKFNSNSELKWSTFYGGNDQDGGGALAFNGVTKEIYITGSTRSNDFPLQNATYSYFQSVYGGGQDAFLMTIDKAGNVTWSTYMGGNDKDNGYGISYDATAESIAFTGATNSTNFPVKAMPGAYNQLSNAGLDLFVGTIERELTGPCAKQQNQGNEIDDVNEDLQFTLNPNPVSGIMNISVLNNLQTSGTIEIYNSTGVLIYRRTLGEKNSSYDLSSYAKGLYLVKLTVDNVAVTKRFILL